MNRQQDHPDMRIQVWKTGQSCSNLNQKLLNRVMPSAGPRTPLSLNKRLSNKAAAMMLCAKSGTTKPPNSISVLFHHLTHLLAACYLQRY
jgi:hypothetical protein